MAPILKIIIQLLPSLPSIPKASFHTKSTDYHPNLLEVNQRQQQPIGSTHATLGDDHAADVSKSTISTIAWGKNRLDVFGLADNNVTHKYWDGYQWGPSAHELELLGNGLATPPVAVTWGVDRLDIFGLDDHNVIKHQYWDGTAWQPSTAELENLGGACDPAYSIAANTWGKDRLDVFCTGPKGDLLHQYYDGSQWQPSAGSLESLGGLLVSAPSVVSRGKDRLDVFAVGHLGDVLHLYWDGNQWSEWEKISFGTGPLFGPSTALVVSSWGENRLDVYGITGDNLLYHNSWYGYSWSIWKFLGPVPMPKGVAATSWSANRLDIVVNGGGRFYYKYFDGEDWKPDMLGWYDKGTEPVFGSSPSVVSWGENRLDIFGVTSKYELAHQAWVGDSWYPSSTEWEILGSSIGLVDDEVRIPDDSNLAEVELRQ
ncbi:MAG: hypothetical protein Q9166_002116 [cf. Caloplaca sp. 2 TL-2023]